MRLTRRTFLGSAGACIGVALFAKRARSSVLVQSYDATGDGIANDLPPLRRALLEAEQRGGGTIRLQPGRFRLGPLRNEAALTIPANVSLEGAGADRTMPIMADGASGHVINAPYGAVTIAKLTVDGNEINRPGTVGHCIRIEGDRVAIEEVRILNAVSYALAVGQRRYSRDTLIRDVTIENAGLDGIDIKNRLGRTKGIRIESVRVSGFGRPLPDLVFDQIGTREDTSRGKAGIDLRGECEVIDVLIEGVLRGRDGLRFRHGDNSTPNGLGAHGSRARNVVVNGSTHGPRGAGVAIFARSVRISGLAIDKMHTALNVGAENIEISEARLGSMSDSTIRARDTPFSTPKGFAMHRSILTDPIIKQETQEIIAFDRCKFRFCKKGSYNDLSSNISILLKDCGFDASCP